jgi:hypothetical protein
VKLKANQPVYNCYIDWLQIYGSGLMQPYRPYIIEYLYPESNGAKFRADQPVSLFYILVDQPYIFAVGISYERNRAKL